MSRRTERTKGGGVVDERRSGVRTHHSRSRSESSMLMFGGSLSRTAVESSSSNDAKDQSGNKFQRNQLAKNPRVLHGPHQKPKAKECHWELDWQKLKFAHRRRRSINCLDPPRGPRARERRDEPATFPRRRRRTRRRLLRRLPGVHARRRRHPRRAPHVHVLRRRRLGPSPPGPSSVPSSTPCPTSRKPRPKTRPRAPRRVAHQRNAHRGPVLDADRAPLRGVDHSRDLPQLLSDMLHRPRQRGIIIIYLRWREPQNAILRYILVASIESDTGRRVAT